FDADLRTKEQQIHGCQTSQQVQDQTLNAVQQKVAAFEVKIAALESEKSALEVRVNTITTKNLALDQALTAQTGIHSALQASINENLALKAKKKELKRELRNGRIFARRNEEKLATTQQS